MGDIKNESLKATAVQSTLSTQWLGRSYQYFADVGSTNDLLKEALAQEGEQRLAAGTVFLADHQNQGRGRLNRRWLAPAGSSLLLSALFRPDWPPEQAQWLTMLASLAAAEAVETVTNLIVSVKWPNDLVVRQKGGWHKFCGLLLEGNMGENGRLQSAVLGVGVNVNIPPAQMPEAVTPATSLLAVTGRPISRLALLADFLQRLETWYEAANNGHSPQPAWNRRLVTLGKRVQVSRSSGDWQVTGMVLGTDEWGRLQVQDESGKLHAIAAGDMTLQ